MFEGKGDDIKKSSWSVESFLNDKKKKRQKKERKGISRAVRKFV